MSEYTPDTWMVVEITSRDTTLYKVFAGWYGGYTSGDSWKLNSGITETFRNGDNFEFVGYSGSKYICNIRDYKLSLYQQSVLETWLQDAKSTKAFNIRLLSIDEVLNKWYNNL